MEEIFFVLTRGGLKSTDSSLFTCQNEYRLAHRTLVTQNHCKLATKLRRAPRSRIRGALQFSNISLKLPNIIPELGGSSFVYAAVFVQTPYFIPEN